MRPRLLGLDEDSLAWRRQLCLAADALLSNTLGNGTPHSKETYARIASPRAGDYVYEIGTFWRGRGETGPVTWPHGCGFLLRVVQEPVYAEGEWDEKAEGRPVPTEDVWYIQYGPVAEGESEDPDVARWSNCSFVMVPLEGDPAPLR